MNGKLQDRVALITGAGRGIGRAIALKMAAEGAHVVINDMDPVPLEETAAEVRKLGREAVLLAGDVTRPGFPEAFVGAALAQFKRLDIIVNNAGFTWDNVIQKMGDEQFDKIIDVHLGAPFRILRAASRHIREQSKIERDEGRVVVRKVVNISSVSGLYGNAGQANYSSAKAGIVGLTKAMSKEWGRYNVNVNAVAFGLIGTRLAQALHGKDAQIEVDGKSIPIGIQAASIEASLQMIPLGRVGTPEEAAGCVTMLCYPESDYVSGQCITCAGGLY